jgi:hypothetical protein
MILSGSVQHLFCLGRLTWFVPAASPIRSVFLAAAVGMLVFHANRFVSIALTSKCITDDLSGWPSRSEEQASSMPLGCIASAGTEN